MQNLNSCLHCTLKLRLYFGNFSLKGHYELLVKCFSLSNHMLSAGDTCICTWRWSRWTLLLGMNDSLLNIVGHVHIDSLKYHAAEMITYRISLKSWFLSNSNTDNPSLGPVHNVLLALTRARQTCDQHVRTQRLKRDFVNECIFNFIQ